MPYTFEFVDDAVHAWHLTDEGAERAVIDDYTPSMFVDAPDDVLGDLEGYLSSDPKVHRLGYTDRYTTLRDIKYDPTTVLRIELERCEEVRTLAEEIRGVFGRSQPPGTIRLFDVDFTPGFRYCLDRDIDPTPDRELRALRIEIGERELAHGDISTLVVDGEPVDGSPTAVLETLNHTLETTDPDVLVLSHGDLIPALEATAQRVGLDGFHLGRTADWKRIAGKNSYMSYGNVGYSPARYRVAGRAIIDMSNSFLWHQSGLDGLLYMVGRARKPIQEAGWASIGTILTAIEIRIARDLDVLAPLNKWDPESFKDVSTLHAADRGGFTFAPEVGLHEDVVEIDFASLYPRIIREYNVSPETVDCACCDEEQARDVVPGLGYRICTDDGFLPSVLSELLEDRKSIKSRLRAGDLDEEREQRLRAQSGAIKWVLVSCFGYQGYRNAKFGRIECHEAINAYAREILLHSKRELEDAGWHVIHGIVDSLWVRPNRPDPEPLPTVTGRISEDIGIDLEEDGRYEWVCFVPLRDAPHRHRGRSSEGDATAPRAAGPAGALTKYFGKREDGTYKYRGIEVRQRSTPAFVADCQRDCIRRLDETRDPAAVCDQLRRWVNDLRRGDVDPEDLLITKRVSKSLEEYRQSTHTVSALHRYERHDMESHPGEAVRYVVVDDDARAAERVKLHFETVDTYDVTYYTKELLRAVESVLSPMGWDRRRIREHLDDTQNVSLGAFVD